MMDEGDAWCDGDEHGAPPLARPSKVCGDQEGEEVRVRHTGLMIGMKKGSGPAVGIRRMEEGGAGVGEC